MVDDVRLCDEPADDGPVGLRVSVFEPMEDAGQEVGDENARQDLSENESTVHQFITSYRRIVASEARGSEGGPLRLGSVTFSGKRRGRRRRYGARASAVSDARPR
jgi:hypothetical protein